MRPAMLTILIAGGLLAQGPGHMAMPGTPLPPPVTEVKAYLALTDAQIQSLQQIQKQEMDAVKQVFEQINTKQKALRDALDKSRDAATVGQLMLDIENLRKQIQEANKKSHDQAVALLTADQKTKLAKLEEAVKLEPVIHQAVGLNLITPPQVGIGPGPGPMMQIRHFGPEPMGAGPDHMMFIRRVAPPAR